MRKLVVSNVITMDGFFEGPHRELDWHQLEPEFHAYAIKMLNDADLLLFGRITYELMAAYWPLKPAVETDPLVAGRMNGLEKIVFSKTLSSVDWSGARLVPDLIPGDITALKQAPGKDIVILGSGSLVSALAALNLIDEFRIIVMPVAIGKGKSMFQAIKERLHMKLLYMQPLDSGSVMLCYEPVRI
jgi:dihydrofolate reductase